MKRLPSSAFANLLSLGVLALVAPSLAPAQSAPAAVAVAAPAASPAEGADVVNYSKLIPFLPKAPAGWTAEPSEGSTTDSAGFKLTTVGCNYNKGEGESASTAAINIIDCSSNRQFMDATTAGWSLTQETTEGYTKTIKLDEFPGFETYDNASKTGSIWVMVAKRFFVHIDLTNEPSAELQKWARSIDLKKLGQVK
jgi:hypothetical protein